MNAQRQIAVRIKLRNHEHNYIVVSSAMQVSSEKFCRNRMRVMLIRGNIPASASVKFTPSSVLNELIVTLLLLPK